MAGNEEAVGAGDADGSDINSAGTVYCPPEDRANQRAVILAHLKRHGSISTSEARRLAQHHVASVEGVRASRHGSRHHHQA